MYQHLLLESNNDPVPNQDDAAGTKRNQKALTVYEGCRDKNIGQRKSENLYSKNFTLSIGNSKNKSPIVTTRLYHLCYFVYTFQSLYTFFNICTNIYDLIEEGAE